MRFVLTLAFLLPSIAAAQSLPEARFERSSGLDFIGRDLAQIFDVSIEGCAERCLAEAACEGFTFNAKKSACFPKAEITGSTPFEGAISALKIAPSEAAIAQARARANAAGFLTEGDIYSAREQAKGLSEALTFEDISAEWARFAYQNLRDLADNARVQSAVSAAINAYLRAETEDEAGAALALLAQGWQAQERGNASIAPLRLAEKLTGGYAEARAAAEAKFGFRMIEHRVDADGESPQICAIFSEPLAAARVDYATYVKTEAQAAVEAAGAELCVSGLSHGARAELVLRRGLPSASGEKLAEETRLNAYIRDRAAAVRFAGRGYVLAREKDAGLPVETVNTKALDLALLRISDRNIVAAMREDYFAQQSSYWGIEALKESYAETVWSGQAEVGSELNRAVTTRLPIQEITGPLGAGIYALTAAIPNSDVYETPPAIQWFVVSDLGMTSFSGVDGLTVALRRLSDADAVAGAEVVLLSRANSVLARAKTDRDGVVRFPPEVAGGKGAAAPALVSAVEGADMAFLSLSDPEFDLSDRGVEGLPPAPAMDLFLATDRGAYRAGETVNATAILRDGAGMALADVPLTAVLMRPDGVEYSRALAQAAGAGGAVLALPVAADAPRGTWRLDVYADPKAEPLASERLLVEDFLPERIDFTPTLPEGVLRQSTLPPLDLTARYLFGAKGAGLAVEGEVRLDLAREIKGLEGYRFGREEAPFEALRITLQTAPTDAEGRAQALLALPEFEEPLPLSAEFVARVSEGSGRPVERRVTRVLMPDAPVLGVKPLFADVVPAGEEARFHLRAFAPDLSGVSMPVAWEVNRIETQYQWYALDGNWNWEPVVHRVRVAKGESALAADGVEIAVPAADGRYELTVTETGKPLGAAVTMGFDAGWYLAEGAIDTPDRLTVALDKPSYQQGDKARLKITAPEAGVALVSVLTNRVVALKSVPVARGDTEVVLKVGADWGTGAYVTATYLRPMAEPVETRAPLRALGLAYAKIDPAERLLNARFETPQTAAPRSALPVALKVEGGVKGETVYATIAAIDLGILNLTAYQTPDPAHHFFGQRRLGVGLRDLYGRLIDGQYGAQGLLRSGGDAQNGMAMKAPPPTEDLMAYFSGPLEVSSDGYVQTEVPLPAFNGTVRLIAMVWSQSGLGRAQHDVEVADPIVLTATAPRFLAPNDRAELRLDLHHRSGPAGEISLAVKAEGLSLAAPQKLTLEPQGSAALTLDLTAASAPQIATLEIALTTPEGKILTKDLTIPIRLNDPATARQSRLDLAAGETFTLDQAAFDGLQGGETTLTAGPLARYNAATLMAALEGYPYGCTEQITSKAMPLLYLSSLAEALGTTPPEALPEKINGAIRDVLLNQDSEGSFGLWAASGGDFWLDAYVSDFLSRARKEGYAVPDTAFKAAMDNLQNRVNYAADFDAASNGGGRALAYALMVLAREGAAAMGDLRYYADEKAADFATPLAAAQLGAALASYGDQPRADALFAQAARQITLKDDGTLREDYGSPTRDALGTLTLARAAGSTAIDLEALGAELAPRLTNPLSTQEAMWALMAAHSEIDQPSALSLNGAPLAKPVLRLTAKDAQSPNAVKNESAAPVTLTVTTVGVPEVPEAQMSGYKLTRSYFDLEGNPVDVAHVAQGTRLVVVLDVQPFEAGGGRLMVADPLPAGFEIDNPNLLRAGDVAALDWLQTSGDALHSEFREDRFLTAIDASGSPIRLAYMIRAISKGSFRHPSASVEDMYRPMMRAQTEAGRVVVE